MISVKDKGEPVQAGEVLFEVVASEGKQVHVALSDVLSKGLRVGDPVLVVDESDPSKKFEGKLKSLSKDITRSDGMYPALIELLYAQELGVGQGVVAHFQWSEKRKVIKIPLSAISGCDGSETRVCLSKRGKPILLQWSFDVLKAAR